MNILERANHHIYKANLDLDEIRTNIKNELENVNREIERIKSTDYTIPDISDAEMAKVHLEIFLEKLG